MTPRPTFATLATPSRLNGTNVSIGCRRNGHFRILAPALGSQCRDNWIWRATGSRESIGIGHWGGCGRRYASHAAAGKKAHKAIKLPSPVTKKTKPNATPSVASKSKPKPLTRLSSPPITVPTKPTFPGRATTTPTLRAKDSLNPPDFTYAPVLTVPPRKAGQNYASYLWGAGRVYLNFYKQGISNVWETRKLAKELREKDKKHTGESILTRAEWQIVRRSRRDMLRLPVFGLLVLCLGEWLPLVVIWLTPVIPESCHIPQQVNRVLRKLEDKRADRLRKVGLDAARLMAKDRRPVGAGMDVNMDGLQSKGEFSPTAALTKNVDPAHMTHFDLMLFSATHDCHEKIWDWLFLTPPKSWLKMQVQKKVDYLRKDDKLIERDGGWAALGSEEVRRACVERGIGVVGKKEGELRSALGEQWVGGRVSG